MKYKLPFLVSFILVAFAGFAQKSNMVFFTQNEEKFYLVINGVQQNEKPLSNVKISGMAAPMQYSVRVKFDKNKTVLDDKVTLQPNTEKTWIVQPKNGTYVIKFSGEYELSSEMLDRVAPDAQEEIIYQPQTNVKSNQEGFSMSMNTGEESASITMNASGVNANFKTNANGDNRDELTDDDDLQQRRPRRSGGCNNIINNLDFKNELNRVLSQTSNAGKKLVAEKIARAYCLTSRQVYSLCNTLSFSNDKLEIAKFCYTNCADPENYEEVYKCFSISAAVRELDEYISKLGYQPIRHQNPIRQNPIIREEEFVPGYTGVKGCPRPMSAANFGDAKNTIGEASFENTKFSTAKTVLATNCITVAQVIEICKMFDFEQTKLDFAKFAYSKTYDRANYYKVNTVFDFDASKESMNRFIQNGGR